ASTDCQSRSGRPIGQEIPETTGRPRRTSLDRIRTWSTVMGPHRVPLGQRELGLGMALVGTAIAGE
ncbi:MAG: hypothetical protein OEW30_13495, partial [Acidimicrobiia bacterium]|nr:hypothetical protein [Acidimicrobiia bacterium]